MYSQHLEGLEPKEFFELFDHLCQIPHESKNEKAISDYIKERCLANGFDTFQDEKFNLIIKKPATCGYEKANGVVLQAHLDMVCQKRPESNHNFATDPIKVLRDGDRIYADGTSLGADDATGIAFALCVLESKTIKHPALEVVFTADEEAGMGGIKALDFSKIEGKVIINLDCSDEGIVVGCAGTATVVVSLPISKIENPSHMVYFAIKVANLKGGHSGLEAINQRANANNVIGRILLDFTETFDAQIVSICGGKQDNAITQNSSAVVIIREDLLHEAIEKINEWDFDLKKELAFKDKDVSVQGEQVEIDELPVSRMDTKKIMALLNLIQNGLISTSREVDNLAELSGNIGQVKTTEKIFNIRVNYRTCFGSLKKTFIQKATLLCDLLGASIDIEGNSPEWEYKADSRLLALIKQVYKEEFGEDILVEVSHGGNECGTFYKTIKDADIVCTGTKISDAHTYNESVLVSNIQKEWKQLVLTLESMLNY